MTSLSAAASQTGSTVGEGGAGGVGSSGGEGIGGAAASGVGVTATSTSGNAGTKPTGAWAMGVGAGTIGVVVGML